MHCYFSPLFIIYCINFQLYILKIGGSGECPKEMKRSSPLRPLRKNNPPQHGNCAGSNHGRMVLIIHANIV
ncbi:unnamed protein product [Spirodela intermedia]|uniref:Uncharacterized protein n=1 Tax=Spirodela intermedia TaxID=51605 RepID=A0A7I8KKY0_SPIIN|nr:unnamed protein product [Spirodela intermedia]